MRSGASSSPRSDADRLDPAARDDVRAIRAYVARDSPRYPGPVAERLVRAVDRLADFPLSGRVVSKVGQPTVREVIEGSYRIVYRVSAAETQIVAVVHAARRFPADEFPPGR